MNHSLGGGSQRRRGGREGETYYLVMSACPVPVCGLGKLRAGLEEWRGRTGVASVQLGELGVGGLAGLDEGGQLVLQGFVCAV